MMTDNTMLTSSQDRRAEQTVTSAHLEAVKVTDPGFGCAILG